MSGKRGGFPETTIKYNCGLILDLVVANPATSDHSSEGITQTSQSCISPIHLEATQGKCKRDESRLPVWDANPGPLEHRLVRSMAHKGFIKFKICQKVSSAGIN